MLVVLFSIPGLYFLWHYSPSDTAILTCNNNIKDGFEEGVDCGVTACGKKCEPEFAPIEVQLTQIFKVGPSSYDFIAQVSNPNKHFGSSESGYEVSFLDKDNLEVLKKEDTFYILPGQKKYIILVAIESDKEIKSAKLEVKSAQWIQLESLEGVDLSINNKIYNILGRGVSSELRAYVFNNSDYDFAKVDIGVVLFNNSGKILAVNKTNVETLIANTDRYFQVTWPFLINGNVARSEVEVTTNLFDNFNYIKRYGSPTEKFQKFY